MSESKKHPSALYQAAVQQVYAMLCDIAAAERWLVPCVSGTVPLHNRTCLKGEILQMVVTSNMRQIKLDDESKLSWHSRQEH